MAFNGSGAFVRLYNWVSDRNAAIKIRADRMDAEMDGMATGLSNCITKDGQTTITQNIPFNNKRLTGVADATDGADALNSHFLGSLCQCELVRTSSSLLTLNRKNGTRVFINGALELIPTTAPTLNVSGASVGTLYYIYAYMSAGVMTLEYSATAPTADTTYGHQIKTGDATRTLVGMARPTTGPAWTDSTTQAFVRSYYNRAPVSLRNAYTALRLVTTVAYSEVNTEIRVEFLSWAGEVPLLGVHGGAFTNGATYGGIAASCDGRVPGTNEGCSVYQNITTSVGYTSLETGLSQGYHYATLMAKISGGGTITLDPASSTVFPNLYVRIGGDQ